MSHSLVFQLLIVMLFGLVSGEILQKNCSENTDGRSLSCYTCLGRDQINCERGLTCCMGSCFKLVDLDHDLIVKGCVNEDEEDASMKVRTLDINLYWANGEKVKGHF
uniref:Secreted protein n=1 Tax=Heterorhabditis bacteriophora TaxID=37862 RepID=A0A1I7XJ58_HETBA